jgi:cell division protein FtsQ
VTSAPLPPGAARRKQLRQQRRADRLRHLWRLTVFSSITVGLGFVLLREGWTVREPAQVEVSGSAMVNREQVIQAAGMRFPQPLLTLQPKELGRRLAAALPVEQVKVSRLMLPPRLRVELVDREAVARAERRSPKGPELGYVDRLGNWITMHQHLGVQSSGDLSLRVVGWNERHRAVLAKVLAARQRIGAGLREIRFEPDGSLWLTTSELGQMRLGPPDSRLERRLEVVEHLNRILPSQSKGPRPQVIDLSDPEQPELSLKGAVPLTSGAAPGSAPARRSGQ